MGLKTALTWAKLTAVGGPFGRKKERGLGNLSSIACDAFRCRSMKEQIDNNSWSSTVHRHVRQIEKEGVIKWQDNAMTGRR